MNRSLSALARSDDALRSELGSLAPGVEIIACRALGSIEDARDAVQEVISRALRVIEQRRPIAGPLGAFVHGIAMHVIADIRRERQRAGHSEGDPDEIASSQPGPLDALIQRQEREAMHAALAQLDHGDRSLLRLCYVEGKKVAAIAHELGEPAARIRKRKSRALQRLRELLGGKPKSHSAPASDFKS